jgi:hypothetical protein
MHRVTSEGKPHRARKPKELTMSRFLPSTAIRRASRQHSTQAPASQEAPLTQQVGPGPRGHLPRRLPRPVLALAASACTLALGLGAASAAQAQVNPAGPHHVWAWGDCSVTLGNVKTSNGAAVGGADITCGHYRGSITAYVYLYRYNGSSWVRVGSGGGTDYNNYRLSAWTAPPVCGNWTSYWDDMVTVNVDGSQQSFDLGSGLGYYPKYAPTC